MKERVHNTYSLAFKRQAVMLANHPDLQTNEGCRYDPGI